MSRVTSPAAGQPDLIDQVPEHGPTLRGWATALGLGGLIPFVALAAGAAVLDVDSARRAVGAQIQCAGSVLSFIGALHWGVALSLYAWLVTVAPAWQPDSDAAARHWRC